MEAANHPEFKRNIIFLTHFLCSSRSFKTRSAFSKTTTELHSDTCKNGPTGGERALWNVLGVAIILVSFSKRKSSQWVEFYSPKHGKILRRCSPGNPSRFHGFFVSRENSEFKSPKKSYVSTPKFPTLNLGWNHQGKTYLQVGSQHWYHLGIWGDPGGKDPRFLPGIPKHSSGVYIYTKDTSTPYPSMGRTAYLPCHEWVWIKCR